MNYEGSELVWGANTHLLDEVAVSAHRSMLLRRPALPLAIAALVASCSKPAPQMPPPPIVTTMVVHPERVAETSEFAAEVKAVRQVEVRSPVAGIIVAQPIPEGAEVQAGTVLFQIDPTNYSAALRGAEARLAQAQAGYDNAARTLARLEPLLAEHAVAQKDVDDAQAAEEQGHAAVDDAKSSADRARKDLTDATVKAEITGRVGTANLMQGARVTGPADLLTTIDVVDPVRITFRPSTQQIPAWRRDPVRPRRSRPADRPRSRSSFPTVRCTPRRASSTLSRRWSIRKPAPRNSARRFPITNTCSCRVSSSVCVWKG